MAPIGFGRSRKDRAEYFSHDHGEQSSRNARCRDLIVTVEMDNESARVVNAPSSGV